MVEELREANLEREGLRSLNERSSAELKKALDVSSSLRERERKTRNSIFTSHGFHSVSEKTSK